MRFCLETPSERGYSARSSRCFAWGAAPIFVAAEVSGGEGRVLLALFYDWLAPCSRGTKTIGMLRKAEGKDRQMELLEARHGAASRNILTFTLQKAEPLIAARCRTAHNCRLAASAGFPSLPNTPLTYLGTRHGWCRGCEQRKYPRAFYFQKSTSLLILCHDETQAVMPGPSINLELSLLFPLVTCYCAREAERRCTIQL